MPRFIYTLFLILFGNLLFLLYLFLFVPPQKPLSLLLFFGALHLFLSLLLSLIFFLISHKKYKKFNTSNKIFRKFFRRVFLGLFLLLAVKALLVFDIYTLVNAVLISLFVLVTYLLLELKMRLPSRGTI
ncbi:MAG: hypothetical protein ABIJ36_00495 [Patescibacteria group bacterium]|nr:hypothetical protein [Patescibacteria group bacterium]